MQDLKTGDWKQTGVITGICTANDGQILSYTLRINGHDSSRHRKFLKKILTRAADVENPEDDERLVADTDIMDVPRPSHGAISPADTEPISSRLRNRARLARIDHSAVTTAEEAGDSICLDHTSKVTEFTVTDLEITDHKMANSNG